MNTGSTLQIDSTSAEDTSRLGLQIGQNLRGAELIELKGDLGSGKTTFVRGLAKGLASHDKVHSPSFTLSNEYKGEKLTLYHFDFYRLDDAGIMRQEIAESLEDEKGVVVVEWPEIVEDVLPAECVKVQLKPTSESTREIEIYTPPETNYLLTNS